MSTISIFLYIMMFSKLPFPFFTGTYVNQSNSRWTKCNYSVTIPFFHGHLCQHFNICFCTINCKLVTIPFFHGHLCQLDNFWYIICLCSSYHSLFSRALMSTHSSIVVSCIVFVTIPFFHGHLCQLYPPPPPAGGSACYHSLFSRALMSTLMHVY